MSTSGNIFKLPYICHPLKNPLSMTLGVEIIGLTKKKRKTETLLVDEIHFKICRFNLLYFFVFKSLKLISKLEVTE